MTAAVAMNTEMDAAEALLELHSDPRKLRPENLTVRAFAKEDNLEGSSIARLLTSLIGSKVAPLSSPPPTTSTPKLPRPLENGFNDNIRMNNYASFRVHAGTGTFKTKSNQQKFNSFVTPSKRIVHSPSNKKIPKQDKIIPKRWSDIYDQREIKSKTDNEIKMMCDKGTQTEVEFQLPEIEKMETIIKDLCAKIETLESQLKVKTTQRGSVSLSEASSDERSSFDIYNGRRSHKRKRNLTSTTDLSLVGDYDSTSVNLTPQGDDYSDDSEADKTYLGNKKQKPKRNSYSCDEMVPIGDGNAVVPGRILRNMDWTSYTNATRKLLTAVFSRRVLATHSLTGRPSPAFPDKPAKKKLNSAQVNDIVQTVVEKCGVPENVVRTSITTKCADESKMYRSRQNNKNKRKNKNNLENIPPSSTRYEDSDYSYTSS